MPDTSNHPSAAKFQRQLNAGTMTLSVLALLERLDRPMYGYQIAKVLELLCEGPLPTKQGTLYPILRALEREGLLVSRMEPSDAGPARRYYRITPAGRKALPVWQRAWKNTRELVDRVLDGRDLDVGATP